MPEQMRQQGSRGLRREWLLGCVAAVAALPALAADSLPASVRACAGITDSLQRLVCYDREVAKYPAAAAQAGTGAAGSGGATSASSGAAVAPGVSASAQTAPPAAQRGADVQAAPSAAQGASGGVSSGPVAAAGTNSAAASNDTPAVPAKPNYDPISAHIVTIDRHPNEMVLHLDNGQVWQQIQAVSGDLSLRPGDEVKIDRHFGSWWLNGPHVTSMKVTRKI